jgi:electron transfer flavoprotein alpha subunit
MSKMPHVFVIGTKASRLADLVPGAASLGGKVSVIHVGSAAGAGDVFGLGAHTLYTLDKRDGVIFEDYAASMARIVLDAGERSLVLLPSDRRGKALAAKLGVMLKAAVVTEASAFSPDNPAKISRLVYGGLAVGVEESSSAVTVVTVPAGVFEPGSPEAGKSGETQSAAFIAPAHPVTLVESRPKTGSTANLALAKRVVGVGRGFSKKEDVALAADLAAVIEAELGCSRPVAEGLDFMERERYIGVSNVSLKANVYIAVGISGQVQHMVGTSNSKVIIAVNKDKNAPIFKQTDYGIVGDLYKVLPALTKALKG